MICFPAFLNSIIPIRKSRYFSVATSIEKNEYPAGTNLQSVSPVNRPEFTIFSTLNFQQAVFLLIFCRQLTNSFVLLSWSKWSDIRKAGKHKAENSLLVHCLYKIKNSYIQFVTLWFFVTLERPQTPVFCPF